MCVRARVYMCVSLTDPRPELGSGAVKVDSLSVRKYCRHTQQPVHYSHHGKRGVANQYLVTVGPDAMPVSLHQSLSEHKHL